MKLLSFSELPLIIKEADNNLKPHTLKICSFLFEDMILKISFCETDKEKIIKQGINISDDEKVKILQETFFDFQLTFSGDYPVWAFKYLDDIEIFSNVIYLK